MYMTMASVAPENVRFSFPEAAASGLRELSDFEIDAISGGIRFRDALNYGRAVFDAAPPEAQFLFLVGAGAAVGALGGVGFAIGGAALGAVSFFAS